MSETEIISQVDTFMFEILVDDHKRNLDISLII